MTEYLKAVQVAEELKIKPSTLRKYSILLEQYNYTFPRNYANQRLYGPEHVDMIKNLQLTKGNPNLKLVKAAEILTEEYRAEEQHSVMISMEEWNTLKREHREMTRDIRALADIVQFLGEEVFRGRREEWESMMEAVDAEYYGEDDDESK